ncbi:26382_t:CDS:2 [Dentiscutata erythropus]|uniref:26382_t:CDS:1 n=1 Tax=Dentiscutata erythropus TaxID=1348616 RepID=A0A9N9HLP1_9GLOM|nr:26382_t:CDS:2 [Dentiscutata erythropus]
MTTFENNIQDQTSESNVVSEQEIVEAKPKFTPEEIEKLVELANSYKITGNDYFAKMKFNEAIIQYEKALDTCPDEKKDERAIYWGNIGACYFKLEKYKDAVDSCTKALEDSPTYTKALLRRAQSNEKLNTFSSLTSALEDYKTLQSTSSHFSTLNSQTRKQVNTSIQRLPPQISILQEKEKNEMIGKLKDVGDKFLGMFGLSTDNFKTEKDPNSGSYSVQFVNSPGGSNDQKNEGNDGSGS